MHYRLHPSRTRATTCHSSRCSVAKTTSRASEVVACFQKYLDEACEAKVSVKVGRSWNLAAYKCFRDMGDAIGWAQKQQKALMKKHQGVQLVVTDRTERQWRNAMLRLKSTC